MAKILGLDLGTNSIGWAIRETDKIDREYYCKQFSKTNIEPESEIVDYGVVVFQKGVGDGKSGEFSLAAERRKNRSKRRLYNAKRYRKWALLKLLIENNMCPLKPEELRLWSIGKWADENGKKKNVGRIFPLDNVTYQQWLAFDPIFFGSKGASKNGKDIRKNPYDLRCELIKKYEEDEDSRKLKLGRVLYHLVQRRGFKSSRKNGKSTYAENAEIEKLKNENSDFQIAVLAKNKIDNGERFRKSGVIQRRYYEDEFRAICDKQKVDERLTERLHKAIYFVRPLRSQKGLVGNCTLERNKPRIPLSHPKFEEFRALQFINNIQWREAKGTKRFEPIPISLKKRILEEIFFRRLVSGKNKGKISLENSFKFEDIIEKYSEKGKYEFNYRNKPNVPACPITAALMNIFDVDWGKKFLTEEDTYGINWEGLKIQYNLKYGKVKRRIEEGKKKYYQKNIGDLRVLDIDSIWHLIFDYIQTKDKVEELERFCKEVLLFKDEKAKAFTNIDIPQGYGSLSFKAISKILPFLRSGYIYSEAVSFANLKSVLGDEYKSLIDRAKSITDKTIAEVKNKKDQLLIVNRLIQKYFSTNASTRAKGVDDRIKEMAAQETNEVLKDWFKEEWEKMTPEKRSEYEDIILQYYLRFLDGKQENKEKATAGSIRQPQIDYYKLPRLDLAIKQSLKDSFQIQDRNLSKLFHPSDIEMYPVSRTEVKVNIEGVDTVIRILESPQPPSKGWKNPMDMRTLHELRHLLNYLLRIGKINEETKVIVEMARELNDANKRWAIRKYQRDREEENIEFAKAIVGVAKQKYPNIDETNIENINKVRLWWEQIENNQEVYEQIRALKEDIDKYRLWKEQGCICMYTGETISLSDLFDGNQTNFEHTLPVSISFDNSLSNLTVCKAYYNMHIKRNQIPTQLANYSQDANGYTAILPRLKKWQEKLKHLKESIEDNIKRSKRIQDPEIKKRLIQNRHLLRFEFDYWDRKVKTFEVKEVPNTWKNSQLADTQIISKYARSYLKTLFDRVDVQKGTVVNDFKKIYQIKGDEQKDRTKHSHHAQDAAILTLIPGSARRETILKNFYEAEETHQKYSSNPYPGYKPSHILEIENNVLINHIPHDNTFVSTFKNERKKGVKTGRIAQGDSIRGRLHKDTFLGAIKPPMRDENGFAFREEGKYIVITNPKTGLDEIWIVSRKPITEVKLDRGKIKDVIIDELLKKHIQLQLDNGVNLEHVVDFRNNPIRHVRMRVKAGVGYLSKEKAIEIKKTVYPSKYEHKKEVLTQNEENYLFLLYEGIDENGKIIRSYRILSLFDIAKLGIKSYKQIRNESAFQVINKKNIKLPLKIILKAGDRVILLKENRDELTDKNIKERMFKLFKFNEKGPTPYLYFQNIIEARPDKELAEQIEFNPPQYQPRLSLIIDKLKCLFEGIDFEVNPDGTVVWK